MQKKILIVDDEPNIIVPLEFLMEQNHYDVTKPFSNAYVVDRINELLKDDK